MKILHLTDLHFGKKYKHNIERMLPSLFNAIKKMDEQRAFDFIIFSGDLVYSGDSVAIFEDVKKLFFDPLCENLGLDNCKLLICPGNHDMNTNQEMKAITNYVNEINTNDALDNFVETQDAQYEFSLANSLNYLSFIKDFYPNDKINPLFHTFTRQIDDTIVGFCSFNTAWRSFIGDDSGKLLLPRIVVHDAFEQIKSADIKIAIHHHPLDDLNIFNKYEIEDLLFEKFHIAFSGHYHKRKQAVQLSSDIGMLSLASSATMSGDDGSTIGFTTVEIDVETYEVKIDNYTYAKGDNKFSLTSNFNLTIPVNSEKNNQIEFLKEIRRTYDNVLLEANSLLIFNNHELDGRNFNDIYSEPIIKDRPLTEVIEKNKKGKKVEPSTLLKGNHILYGKDKSGKSTLLRRIQLDILQNFKTLKTIPIYIDMLKLSDIFKFDITTYIRATFHLNSTDSEKLLQTNHFKYLLDNFNTDNPAHNYLIKHLNKSSTNNNFVITSNEHQSSYIELYTIEDSVVEKCFIYPISRSNIRTQTDKLLNDFSESEKQDVTQKIVTIFSQLGIPFDYWSLSIFLWLYKKDRKIIFNDNIELLILYMDKLLEREQIAIWGKDIDYQLFNRLLGRLSHDLLTNYKSQFYSLSYQELYRFIEEFKAKSIRFVTDTQNLIQYLLEKGVIKKDSVNGLFSFRLNGVMEYFTAIYMSENSDFVQTLINDDSVYLNFSNEFEILSGLNRNNADLLDNIFKKTVSVLNEVNIRYDSDSDMELTLKIANSRQIARDLSTLNLSNEKPINFQEQDELFDDIKPTHSFNEDVKIKEPLDLSVGFAHSHFEKHLLILSRVFRSMSLIENDKMTNEVFDFILNSSINLGFELLSELKKVKKKPQKEFEKL